MYPTIAMQLVEIHRQELWAEAAEERFARAARRTDAPSASPRRSPWSALRILVASRLQPGRDVRHAGFGR